MASSTGQRTTTDRGSWVSWPGCRTSSRRTSGRCGRRVSRSGSSPARSASAKTPVRTLLRRHGGVKPPPRARNRRHLSLSEREEISRGLAAGLSCRVIAARLGRHHTSISREVARHGGPGTYRAASADAGAWRNARRPKTLTPPPRPGAVEPSRGEAGTRVVTHPDRPLATARTAGFVVARVDLPRPCTPARSVRHDREASCDQGDPCAMRASRSPDNAAACCGTWHPFTIDPPASKTGPKSAIGKVTSSWASARPPWPPSSNAPPAWCASSPCPTGIRLTPSGTLSSRISPTCRRSFVGR
ncbi:helix-turn-helix domain-containing protein [Dermacoccus abyssi]|uniref:Helix-turn-helix domain-containing protein n=1 Tax=Dermacoccus abyssi TaxID=322596 RepID=A0ABX5Z793_9MICO|nr:helix-turn-helix domain-containing protein [Dermacoccus abyssi]